MPTRYAMMPTRHVIGTSIALIALGALGAMFHNLQPAHAHCQVPCGIYDDEGRIQAMKEDVATITKAIAQINELTESMADGPSSQAINQSIRWVQTKEDHASKIIETVSLYFLTQKVKPVAAGADGYQQYLKALADHHAVMRAAMTAKQKTDPAAASALEAAVTQLGTHYAPHSH